MAFKGKILAVDDTPAALKLLTDLLNADGYEVRSAINGELALNAATNNPPDLVLLDIRMPGMHGFEVCRRLKAHPATRDIPVIILSAASETDEKVLGFEIGAIDFVTKPFQREELLARVRTHMELGQLRNHLESLVNARTAELMESERRLRESEERLNFTLHSSHTGGWELDLVDHTAGRTLEYDHIFGYESILPQWTYELFLEHVVPEDRSEVDCLFQEAIAKQSELNFECQIRRADGELRWIWVAGKHKVDETGIMQRMAGIVQDITDRKKAEETIYDLAFYDPLTRLPNRRLLLDRLQQTLLASARMNRVGAILLINLDDFKLLNDTQSHEIGDLLLVEVTEHLKTCIDANDTLARIGGDEFVVVLDTSDSAFDQAAAYVRSVAEKILTAINLPLDLRGHEYHCSACIGITLFHGQDVATDELLKFADMAMHQAKQAGRNNIRFFDHAIQAALESRVQMESWMRKALNDQYQLYYQIQVDGHGKAIGSEALIRWWHPERGMIYPADFIPLAEETGLILPIGEWVLESACAQLKAWEQDPYTRHLMLAVNVSAKQFYQSGFVEQVLAVLDRTGADPNRLKLELTESLLVDNVEDVISKMTALKAKGVTFALDDFGTGFSSLSYLKRLPLSQLKIDRFFVRNVLTDPHDAAIVRTVIALGHSMGVDVVAEGVETEAHRVFLASNGCNHFQGYLFGKPVPLDDFELLLRQGQ